MRKIRSAIAPHTLALCIDKNMTFLYRYYGNIEYALDVVLNTRLYFSLQSEFNDPFDCLPKFSLLSCKNDGEEKWRRFLAILAKYENPKISESELQHRIDNTLQNQRHPSAEWLKGADIERDASLRKILNDRRICCFTKCPRNQMMWAHYANNHHGLVLQFRQKYMADGKTGETKYFPVEYYKNAINLEQYISIFEKGLRNPLEFANFMYCSKSEEWAGEKEIRFFSKEKYIPFPEEMLTGILFGSNAPESRIQNFSQLVSKWKTKPNIFKENLEESRNKMIFNLLKT